MAPVQFSVLAANLHSHPDHSAWRVLVLERATVVYGFLDGGVQSWAGEMQSRRTGGVGSGQTSGVQSGRTGGVSGGRDAGMHYFAIAMPSRFAAD